MARVRIKNLQDAKGIVDKFDDFDFAVDSGNPDTTMKLSGKELKKVIGTPLANQPSRVRAVTWIRYAVR